jgi:hypothetical protein
MTIPAIAPPEIPFDLAAFLGDCEGGIGVVVLFLMGPCDASQLKTCESVDFQCIQIGQAWMLAIRVPETTVSCETVLWTADEVIVNVPAGLV